MMLVAGRMRHLDDDHPAPRVRDVRANHGVAYELGCRAAGRKRRRIIALARIEIELDFARPLEEAAFPFARDFDAEFRGR